MGPETQTGARAESPQDSLTGCYLVSGLGEGLRGIYQYQVTMNQYGVHKSRNNTLAEQKTRLPLGTHRLRVVRLRIARNSRDFRDGRIARDLIQGWPSMAEIT